MVVVRYQYAYLQLPGSATTLKINARGSGRRSNSQGN